MGLLGCFTACGATVDDDARHAKGGRGSSNTVARTGPPQATAEDLHVLVHHEAPRSPPRVSPPILLPPPSAAPNHEDDAHDFVSCASSFTSATSGITAPQHPHTQLHCHHAPLQTLPEAALEPQQPPDLAQSGVVADRGSAQAVAGAAAPSPHLELLSTVARLYKKHGHPCSACQHVIRHCAEHHVPYDELEAALAHLAPGSAAAAPSGGDDELLREMRGDVERLVRAARYMAQGLRSVLDDAGWTVCQDDAFKMCYRHEPGTTKHSFKGRCILDARMVDVMALVREFDLAKTWNRFCVDSPILRQHSFAEMAVCAVMWLPWPAPNMNIVMEAVGCDLLDTHGGFLITLGPPGEEVQELLPPAIRGNMQPRMEPGSCVLLEPLPPLAPAAAPGQGPAPPPRVRATVEVHLDPGVHVPAFLITFLLKVLGPFMYRIIASLLKHEFSDPTKPLPSRIPALPALYGLVERRTDEYLARAQREGLPLPRPIAGVLRTSSSSARRHK